VAWYGESYVFAIARKVAWYGDRYVFDTKSLGGNKKKRPFEKHTENTGLLLCYPFISISISLNW